MANAPKYEVIKTCWLDQPDARSDSGFAPRLLRPGEKAPLIVHYDGWPNAALKPLDAEGKRRAKIVADYQNSFRRLPKTVAEYDEAEAAAAKAAKHAKAAA